MKYANTQIEELRLEVGKRLSEKRFIHTLGVEEMAVLISEKCMPERIDEIRVAALLHDISKEYSEAEHLSLLKKHNVEFSDEDRAVSSIWHSITGPLVVMDEFYEFATEDVLSAIRNHTVGSPDMSLFDEIIFLSDYIESGRTHSDCVTLRNKLLTKALYFEREEQFITQIHSAVVESLENNIRHLTSQNNKIHSKTKLTRDAIKAKLER